MAEALNIAVILGSLRANGLSRALGRVLTRLAPPKLAATEIRIGELPMYNQDLDDAGTPPADWMSYRSSIRSVDGVLFVTPEHNRSVPAALKNAIDVGSRPYGQSAWAGKPAGILTISPGGMGGFGANHHLRQSLVFLDMPVLQQPEAYIGNAGSLFGADGTLANEQTEAFLAGFMNAFSRWVELHAGASLKDAS